MVEQKVNIILAATLFLLVEDEREKFEYLYARYKNLLLHKAYEILRDPMLAEDAVSESFIRIFKNLHKISDPESGRAAAFVVTVTKNVALSLFRKEKGQSAEEFDDTLQDQFDLESYIDSQVGAEAIIRVVDQLGEDLKSVFLLKYAYDMTHREIGKALHISENNVTVRLHRAKKRIASALAKEGLTYGREQVI